MAKQIATFLGPNKGLSIVGDYFYAYSGIVSINNVETTLLEFQTPKIICVGSWRGDYYTDDSDDIRFVVLFNNQIVSSATFTSNKPPVDFYHIIIPPLTAVKVTAQNITDTSAQDVLVSTTGRVYDA